MKNNHTLENVVDQSNETLCKVRKYTKVLMLNCRSSRAVSCPCFYFSCVGSWRISDLSLTNSFATSSLLLCHRIRRIVQPVSSLGMLLNSGSHRAHERCEYLGKLKVRIELRLVLLDRRYLSVAKQPHQQVYLPLRNSNLLYKCEARKNQVVLLRQYWKR